MDFVLDTSDFDKKFREVIKKAIPERVETGLGVAMLLLLRDCVLKVPTCPIREGFLRGSGSIFVQNDLVGVSEFGKKGKAVTSYTEPIDENNYVGLIGFNTPYAAKMHEGINFKFSEPSSGAKYLESKMVSYGRLYMESIADAIKKGAK